jgi:[protein-PII] uridylyltransferase
LGGFGRKELSPFSDIDLLFLFPKDGRLEEIIRRSFTFWDGLRWVTLAVPGGACRWRKRFSFLTSCWICAGSLQSLLFQTLKSEISRRPKAAETLAGMDRIESEKRHHRYDWAFFLSHLKEGLGGLWDIHLLLWLGKALRRRIFIPGKFGPLTWDDGAAFSAELSALTAAPVALHHRRKNDACI